MTDTKAAPRRDGFTLIEILIALALGMLVLLVASNVMTSTTRSATDVQARNELLEESQIAQNYMASQIKEAVYVFPSGTQFNLGTGATTKKPTPGTWTTGEAAAPIVALIRPPENAATTTCNDGGCYSFYAYYPVKRSTWVAGTSSFNDPGDDPVNTDRWVLAEYRSNFTDLLDPTKRRVPTQAELQVMPYNPPGSGIQARLLLDYVQPTTEALAGTPPLFEVNNLLSPAGWSQSPGNISVAIHLAMHRVVSGKDVYVPARSTPQGSVTSLTVLPRNLGNLPP